MLATAWLLGIANPQSIKRLGHFLTADNISAGTPNGGQDISSATEGHFLTADCKSARTPNGGWAYPALRMLLVLAEERQIRHYLSVAGR